MYVSRLNILLTYQIYILILTYSWVCKLTPRASLRACPTLPPPMFGTPLVVSCALTRRVFNWHELSPAFFPKHISNTLATH